MIFRGLEQIQIRKEQMKKTGASMQTVSTSAVWLPYLPQLGFIGLFHVLHGTEVAVFSIAQLLRMVLLHHLHFLLQLMVRLVLVKQALDAALLWEQN